MSGYSTRRIVELEDEVQRLKAENERLRAGLLDRFAAAALTGIASNPASGCNSESDLAHWAYRCAGAMLKAREAR